VSSLLLAGLLRRFALQTVRFIKKLLKIIFMGIFGQKMAYMGVLWNDWDVLGVNG